MKILIKVKKKIDKSPLAKRYYSGAIWSVLSSAVTSAVTVVLMMLIARLLEKDVYGKIVLLQTTLNMVGVFAGFGIGVAVIKYSAELKLKDKIRLGKVLCYCEVLLLCFGTIFCSLLILYSDLLSSRFLGDIEFSTPLVLSSISIIFISFDSYQKSVLIGFESMRDYAISSIFGVILGAPILYFLSIFYGLNGAGMAISINAIILVSISRLKMNGVLRLHKIKKQFIGCLSNSDLIWKYALPSLVASSMLIPANWIVQSMLAKSSDGYSEVAALGIAMQWFNLLIFIPSTTGRILFPMFSEVNSNKDYKKLKKLLNSSLGLNFIVSLPLLIGVMLFSDKIMGIYGGLYKQDGRVIVISAMAAFIVSLQIPYGILMNGLGKMWAGVFLNVCWAGIYIYLSCHYIEYGSIGVASSLLGAYALFGVLLVVVTRIYLNKNQPK